ncbi:GntR family transcriptional regulator [Frigidibacter sp. ROC022]|uniref:GntR family transcriptional regulator n=1 Tax=Frigidibacter sp. ROC022 TaxID=2971796 RepID=UPI00215B5227|nr:GntR family transcriptional regulator [Frigidibacter sp. ROC022]MCR8726475.1 GntR family transcriptional regulator [Frigidibacter sp. ROC022]
MAAESFDTPTTTGRALRPSARRSHQVFEALQQEIVLGTLEPSSALTELDLAQRFGCSQGTIREALMRLNEEGLVNRQPNRGTYVAPCAADDARALLEIRRGIECNHLVRVVASTDATLLGELRASLDAMRNAARDGDEYRLSTHDRGFHARIFAAADLPLLAPILNRCLIHNHRYKILNSQPNRALEETAERHVPIISALAQGDVDQLRQLLDHHITTIVDFGPDLRADNPGKQP